MYKEFNVTFHLTAFSKVCDLGLQKPVHCWLVFFLFNYLSESQEENDLKFFWNMQ